MSILDRFFQDADKRSALSWALFDFANSSYSLLIISFAFPIFFKEVIAGPALGDFYWGLINSISIIAGGLIAPFIGAAADFDALRKRKFILFTLLAVAGTVSLYFTGKGTLLLACVLFIATNFFYELAIVLYDSFLVQTATEKTTGRISALGWGLGYLGGIVAMLLLRPFYANGFEGSALSLYKRTFPLTALFFLIFALPSFFFLRDEGQRITRRLRETIAGGFANVIATVREIRSYKQVAYFLLAFYFMNDVLVTLFAFVPLFARTTLGMSIGEISALLFVVQLIGVPATIFLGWLSDKKGSKKILLLTLGVWIAIIIGLSLAQTKAVFFTLAALTGLVIGSCQAIARSWLSKIIPAEKRCQFFGFNGFASKVAATTGPVLFGTVSVWTGSQRIAMLALLPFFIISFAIFARIKENP